MSKYPGSLVKSRVFHFFRNLQIEKNNDLSLRDGEPLENDDSIGILLSSIEDHKIKDVSFVYIVTPHSIGWHYSIHVEVIIRPHE
jgi:hypothetical protein